MLVHLIKPLKRTTVSYVTRPLMLAPTEVVVRAQWTRPAIDLGYTQIAPGDMLDEYFYADEWFNVFTWFTKNGRLRGWYCNVTRPAIIRAGSITSVDLELDLFVSANRQVLTRLDIDEFEVRGYQQTEPDTYRAGYAALAALEARASSGAAPFDRTELL